MLKLTYTAHGAHLSNGQRLVTHTILRPGVGIGSGFVLYKVVDAYCKTFVGTFSSMEAAHKAAEAK